MPRISRPSVRLIYLSQQLQTYRRAAGMSSTEVCAATGISGPTFSRIENAGTTISATTVETLLELYGVTGGDHDALVQLARESSRRGWWTQFDFPTGFAGLEDESDAYFAWKTSLVPGLLQTAAYHEALLVNEDDPLDRDAVHRRIRARLNRQAILRDRDRAFHFVLGEAVIRQMVGGPEVMRPQLVALWEAAQVPNTTVQVVPFSAGAHLGLGGSFTILGFRRFDMEIGHTEGAAGTIYLESTSGVASINLRRESVTKAALSPHDSAALLREAADSFEE